MNISFRRLILAIIAGSFVTAGVLNLPTKAATATVTLAGVNPDEMPKQGDHITTVMKDPLAMSLLDITSMQKHPNKMISALIIIVWNPEYHDSSALDVAKIDIYCAANKYQIEYGNGFDRQAHHLFRKDAKQLGPVAPIPAGSNVDALAKFMCNYVPATTL